MSPRVWAGRKPSDTPSPLQHQQPPKAARTSPSREQPRPPPGLVLAHHALPPACVRLQGRNSYASLRTQHSQPSPRGHSLGLPWPPAALRPPPASPGLPRAARSQRNRAMLSYSAPHSPAPPACARTQSMPGIQGPEGSCACLVPPHPWYPARHTVADRYTCPPGSHSLEVSPEPQGEEAAGTEGVPAPGERSRGGVSQAQTWATGCCFSSSRRCWGSGQMSDVGQPRRQRPGHRLAPLQRPRAPCSASWPQASVPFCHLTDVLPVTGLDSSIEQSGGEAD